MQYYITHIVINDDRARRTYVAYVQGKEAFAWVWTYGYICAVDICDTGIGIDVVVVCDELPVYSIIWLSVSIVIVCA